MKVLAKPLSAGLLTASLLGACGGGAEVLLIPLFEFGFSGTAGASSVQLFFLPDVPTTATGSFSTVNMNVDARPQIHYDGDYRGCSFQLRLRADSVAAAPIAASYEGRFVGRDVIELVPPGDSGLPTLRLTRSPLTTRQSGC